MNPSKKFSLPIFRKAYKLTYSLFLFIIYIHHILNEITELILHFKIKSLHIEILNWYSCARILRLEQLTLKRLPHFPFSTWQGRSQGEMETPLPKQKKCCRKMVLFPRLLVLVTNFAKIIKNSIFYRIFIKNFQNFKPGKPFYGGCWFKGGVR